MIRTLLATTALTALLTTGAIAQNAADPAAPATTETQAEPMQPATDPASGSTTTNNAGGSVTTTDPVGGEPVEANDVGAQNANANANMQNDRQAWDMSAGYVGVDTDNLATRLIDQPVYSSAGDDAEEIGNVTDLVFNESGQINAVVIGVGGFLGIGEKSVAVNFSDLEFVLAADNTERWVLPTTADALNAAPDFVWEEDRPGNINNNVGVGVDAGAGTGVGTGVGAGGAMTADPAMAPADPAMNSAEPAVEPAGNDAMAPAANNATTTETTTAPAANNTTTTTDTTTAPAAGNATMGTDQGAMAREGYQAVEFEALTADNLTGATVVGPDGEDIAEVSDILLSQDGQVDALLVDFGGFLGLGQKTVAVSMDNLEFAANEDGDLLVYTDFTREQLEAAPEYDEAAYASDPTNQRATDM